MKEGDLITTYYKGFYRLKRIERRYYTQGDIDRHITFKDKKVGEEYSPLYYFTQEYTDEGKLVSTNKEKCCDVQFCKPVSDYISKEIENMRTREIMLNSILEKENSLISGQKD